MVILPDVTPGPVTMFKLPFSARILSTAGRLASSASRLMSLPRSAAACVGRAGTNSRAASAASSNRRGASRFTSFYGVASVQHECLVAAAQGDLIAGDALHL